MNGSMRQAYCNFEVFASAELNHCFGHEKNKILSIFCKFCQNISAKDIWHVAYLMSTGL